MKVGKIGKIVSGPSYYPEMPRKSRGAMWRDNFKWLCRYKELNLFYNSYGLDVKEFRDPEEFLSNSDFRDMRNRGNRRAIKTFYGSYNYLVLLRDKYVFSAHISGTIGSKYVPKTIALIDHGKVFLTESGAWMSFSDFCKTDGRIVFKVVDGTFGDDVYLVQLNDGKLTTHGQTYEAEEFLPQLGQKRFIVQELIIQHPALQAFGTGCVNTIRTITVRGKSGNISVFAAFLRVGTDTESFVDNRAKGGLAVGVDLKSGKLMKYGFPHAQFGTKYEIHPLSSITFEDYQLPYWEEVVELVCSAHRQFYEMQSIGWDVAITENGPVLLEGNDSWEIGGPQDTFGGLKKKWDELRNN